eukprot:gene14625-16781_t
MPSGVPTKFPTTSAPTRPGDTNKPTAGPTSQPSLDLLDFATQRSYQTYLNTRTLYQNVSQSFAFANYYYKGSDVDGTCSAWQSLVDNSLALPFSDLYLSKISLDFVVDNFPTNVLSQATASCSDLYAIENLVSSLRLRKKFQIDCNGVSWRVFSCNSNPVICVNCKENCVNTVSCPGTSNIINPCYSDCSSRIASGSNVYFQYSLRIFYPILTDFKVLSAAQNSVTVSLNASTAGNIYCAAFEKGSTPTSVLTIRATGSFALNSFSRNTAVSLTLSGLNADTAYDVYCYSEDFSNHVMPLSVALGTKSAVSTACCRAVTLVTSYPSILQYFATTSPADESRFELRLNARPSSVLRVSLKVVPVACVGSNNAVTVPDATVLPSSMSFYANSSSLQSSFIVRSSVAGCFRISAEGTGIQTYTGFTSLVTVRNIRAVPVPPVLTSAVYLSDGSAIIASFDSETNRADTVLTDPFGSFVCSKLFAFTAADSCTCLWISTTQLSISSAKPNILPLVQASITLLANVVRPKCVLSTICSSYLFTPVTTVLVSAPVTAIRPVVSIAAAPAVGSCDDILLDPQSSTGFAGRSWSAVVWSVVSTRPVNDTDIATYLNANFPTTAAVATLPNRFLQSARSYTFSLALTNFLGQTGVGSVTVGTSAFGVALPQVRIIGPGATSYRWKDVNLFASSVFPACVGNTNIVTTFVWKAFAERNFNPALVTTSLDARYFKLNPYTLIPGTVYTFQVTATATYAGISYSASTAYTLAIGVSGVTAAIAGSSQVTSVVSRAVTFDASSSFDVDYPTGSVLSYAWACSTIAPTFGTSCSNLIPSRSLSSITLAANTLTAGTFNFSVTVSNALGASSLASVQLTTNTRVVPAISIATPAVKYNVDQKIILSAQVISTGVVAHAAWTSASVTSLTKITNSNTQKAVVSGTPLFQLSIKAYALTAGLSYTFSLTANYNGNTDTATAAVTIVINTAPVGGVVSASPSTGTALLTTYLISTSMWTDDATDLPLRYTLSYYTQSVSELLPIKAQDTVTFASTFLGQGLLSLSYRNTIVASAMDIYDGFANTTTTVIVLPVPANSQLTVRTKTALDAALLDKNPTTVNQIVTAATKLELLQAFRESLCRSMYASLAQQDVSLDVMNSRAVTVAELVLDMTQVNDNAFFYCTSVMVDTVVARPDL